MSGLGVAPFDRPTHHPQHVETGNQGSTARIEK